MKSVILRFFNASMGYLVVKKIVLTGHRKITKRFLKLLPHSKFLSLHQILDVYENWTRNFKKEQVEEYYMDCLELLKHLYNNVVRETDYRS